MTRAGHLRSRPPRREDPAEAAIGRVLGSYRLVQLIGRGGMGRVYLAEHVRLGRRVALKLLRPEYSAKRDLVARFFQEAKAVNRIRHRNIVDATDFVELDDGTTFIIMELLEGSSLAKLARESRLAPRRVLALLAQVCDGLHAAHSVGIIHRDLKPDNVFVVPGDAEPGGETVKLLDFGVAKLLSAGDRQEPDGDDACMTAVGSVVGTPAYMSPEQAAGLDVDHRSDVYALGAIMYELLCGQLVFQARSFGEFMLKHVNEVPVPPRQTPGGRDLPAELEPVVLRCLAKSAEDRYATAAELRQELSRLVGLLDASGQAGAAPRAPSPSPWRLPVVLGGVVTGIGAAYLVFHLTDTGAGGRRLPAVRPPVAPAQSTPSPGEALGAPGGRSDEVRLAFRTDPSGALVLASGSQAVLCTTPCEQVADRAGDAGNTRVFVFRLDGYVDQEVAVTLAEDDRQVVHATLARATTPPAVRRRDDRVAPDTPPPAPSPDAGVSRIDRAETMNPFTAK